ncbi:MAG: YggN family protein [Thermomonas sp.]|uniref:DUF2884 family protein n=1 Tax=Thermomonas sp. TaxID=1971895 RepID=UPI001ECAF1BC|nr:DUF2884 family protein [Thermomonas sp.]MBV2208174.1 YggN family protein [Thermomonas sp.]
MNSIRHSALACLIAFPLLACSNNAPPPAAPADNAPAKGFIGKQVDKAFAKAREEMAKGNIDIGNGPHVTINGKDIGHNTKNLPKAEITPQGDLLIAGKAAPLTADQRQQLLAYRGQIIDIAEAGMAIGSQGVGLADKALSGVAGAIFGGEKGAKEFEAKMEAEGEKIEAEARKLCTRLPAMMASQQALATTLPAFKPYASMTQADIDDCYKDSKDKGAAVMSQ